MTLSTFHFKGGINVTIEEKIDKIQDLIGDICEEIAMEQPAEDDEEAQKKFAEIFNHLEMAHDQAYDLRTAYEAYQDYIEADHEPYYFNNSYNGVSNSDFA